MDGGGVWTSEIEDIGSGLQETSWDPSALYDVPVYEYDGVIVGMESQKHYTPWFAVYFGSVQALSASFCSSFCILYRPSTVQLSPLSEAYSYCAAGMISSYNCNSPSLLSKSSIYHPDFQVKTGTSNFYYRCSLIPVRYLLTPIPFRIT
jgi:hypothetical protein